MRARLASLCLSSSLLSLAAVAGCAEPDGARFADASPAQLERVYQAASGYELASVMFLGTLFSGRHDPTACLRIETEGQDTTVTGDCTTEHGVRLEGSIAIHNLPGYDEDPPAYDPSQPSSVEIDFRIENPERGTMSIAGRVEYVEEPVLRLSGDLTTDTGGITSVARLDVDCDVEQQCTVSPGAEIEISDLGRADVEGTWQLIDEPDGRLIVRGADVLDFDVAGREGRCVPYTIGDERGTVCVRDIEIDEWLVANEGRGAWVRVPAELAR